MIVLQWVRRRVGSAWLPHAVPALGHEYGEQLARAVTGVAALAALAIAVAFPAAYLLSAHNRLVGVLEAHAEVFSGIVTEKASESPVLWNAFVSDGETDLSGISIAKPDDTNRQGGRPEQQRVFSADGRLLYDIKPQQPLGWPVVSRSAAVMQNGNRLGHIEVIRSLRPELFMTLAIGAGSFTFGLMLLVVLRIIPLRLMNEALNLGGLPLCP